MKALQSPLDCKQIQPVHPKGNHSWIFMERLMLKLKLQYFGHLMWRADSFEKTWCWEGLGAGGEADERGWDGWMASPTQWAWVWVNSGSWWWTGKLGVLQSMESQIDTTEWLNWTECTNICALIITNIPYYYKMLMVRGNCVQVCGNS